MALNDYYTLGSSGLRVSSLALGTMTFDDGSWGSRPADSFAILDCYLGLGGNFIDTANFYGGGQSEQTLGAYFTANPDKRERVVLATKFCMSLIPDDPNAGGAGRKAIIAQLDRSLSRLKTDYVDLYWQHMWDRHTPIEETLSTLNDLVRAGKVRNIGMSNVPAWFVGEAVAIARLRGWEPIAALQVQYSLLTRTVEGEQFGAARAFGLGIVPWSPLANGTLSGKYSRERTSDPASSRAKYAKLDEATFAVLDVLEHIASTLGVTVAQVALAWVRQQPSVTSTLIGARTIHQLETNLASIDVDLDDAVVAELNALTKPDLGYPWNVLPLRAGIQQGSCTINGVSAEPFVRQK
jgi:aryl-alcohol dehydrogenase-like predicted oxidoreductase